MKIRLAPLFAFLFFTMLNAQSECPCCTARHQEFDFWLGEWGDLQCRGKGDPADF